LDLIERSSRASAFGEVRGIFASKLRLAHEKKKHTEAYGIGLDSRSRALHHCDWGGPIVSFPRLPEQPVSDGTLLRSNYSQGHIAEKMTLMRGHMGGVPSRQVRSKAPPPCLAGFVAEWLKAERLLKFELTAVNH